MKKILMLTIVISLSLVTFAQKETSNWTFGRSSYITWNKTQTLECTGIAGTPNATLTGFPTFVTGGSKVNTVEGCITMSDRYSNLLFYTDGVNIYDKNHTSMLSPSSTLKGHPSAAQSASIVPYPGNTPNKYLLITTGAYYANNTMFYTIDTSSGLAKMTTGVGSSDILRNAPGKLGESVAVVLHPNGNDYWVIVVSANFQSVTIPTTTAYLNAWLFTKDGPALSPITTSFPIYFINNGAWGYLKLTANKKHFVWPSFADNSVTIGDFDPWTGMFSNIKTETQITAGDPPFVSGLFYSPYGVEFSPDQSILYLTDTRGLYMYKTADLFSGASSLRYPYKAFYDPTTGRDVAGGALQMGPDRRIYWARGNNNYLCVIDNISDIDNVKVYKTPDYFLDPDRWPWLPPFSGIGLPNFSTSWFEYAEVDNTIACVDNIATFNINIPFGDNQPISILWDFGDDSTIVEQTISGGGTYTQEHKFSLPGKYYVSASPYRANGMLVNKVVFEVEAVNCLPLRMNPNVRLNLGTN